MSPKKFTFKKQPAATGLESITQFYPDTEIKTGGKVVGLISFKRDGYWLIGLTIKKTKPDENKNCDWRWAFFVQPFTAEKDARAWLNERWQEIESTKGWVLHSNEEDK
jgi:hypothetical protein